MRRIAVVLAVVLLAAVAYGRPRISEPPRFDETLRPEQLIPRSGSSITSSAGDTVWYGGTTWMPDSMRWEAILDSVWTFETGVGSWINTGQIPGKPVGLHGGMEGWYGFVPDQAPRGVFERSPTCAIGGAYSLWAGIDSVTASARCYSFAAGQGYGNSWRTTQARTFFYPGSGSVTLSYDYAVESEPGFDYAYVVIDTSGNGSSLITLATYTGVLSGTDVIALTPRVNLRSTPGDVTILFKAQSDGSYSDEDGLYPTTCGLLVIDNVQLSGAISDLSDFESGEDGWAFVPIPANGGLSHLAAIADLPPVQVSGPCAVEDSVLVFHNQTFRIPFNTQDLAVSPWIDLRRNNDLDRPGKFVSFDLYWEEAPSFMHPLLVPVMVRTQTRPCEEFGDIHYYWFGSTPWCSWSQPVSIDVSDFIDPVAEQVQIAIGVSTLCGVNCSYEDTWFDNVRFGVYGMQTGVPEAPEPTITRLGVATPNPFRTSTSIAFTLEHAGPVNLAILDVAGRRVRTLVDSEHSKGTHHVDWNGLDDSGRPVPNGLYFYRITAEGRSETKKLVILR